MFLPLSHLVHVKTICVRPNVMCIILDSLSQWIGNLMKPDEFTNFLHLWMIPSCGGVKSGYYRSHISKYSRIKQSCMESNTEILIWSHTIRATFKYYVQEEKKGITNYWLKCSLNRRRNMELQREELKSVGQMENWLMKKNCKCPWWVIKEKHPERTYTKKGWTGYDRG